MTSDNEFGWIWRQQQNYGIEGIHHCQALLRTHKTVKYILAEVELITDWKRFGAWMKQIDCIVPVVENQQ
jgi:tRNA G18 (ribose-2'-O)-methylase SpoU